MKKMGNLFPARNFSTTLNLSPSSSFSTTPSTSTLLTHSTVVHAESTETAVSGDVPVAAIVVPVLTVVVLAIAVLLFVLSRRRYVVILNVYNI